MRKFFQTIGLVSFFAANLNAATVTITNFDGVSATPFFNPILTASGSLLTSGIVVIGTYTSTPTSFVDVLGGNFVQAGNSSVTVTNGFFQGNITTPTLTNGDSFVGNSVYVVIGNGTTLANSTELLAWQALANPAGNVFVADDPTGGPNSVAIRNSTGEARVGNEVNFDFGAGGPGIQPALQLVAVPEPSSLILSVIGVLALLRRKR